jgi:hypothetical protein
MEKSMNSYDRCDYILARGPEQLALTASDCVLVVD